MKRTLTIKTAKLPRWKPKVNIADSRLKRMVKPHSRESAEQCREMGIRVGDTIFGREESLGGWNEAKLTLLWKGKTGTVWCAKTRNSRQLDWQDDGEQANWTLDLRQWYKAV